MSQDAPLLVHDDDNDALPDDLTSVLLREDSRQGIVLRPPNPVVALSAGTPAPARPVTAIPPVMAGAPAGGSSVRSIAPAIPVSKTIPHVQQQVAAAPMPLVAPIFSQQTVLQHRPQLQQQQQRHPKQGHQQQQQHQPTHQHQKAPVQRHQPQAFQRQTQQHQAQKHQTQQHQAQQLPVQPHQAKHNQTQQPVQQTHQSSDSVASRPRANKNESPAQTAVWNCVYYNIHMYQQSILHDVHNMIARAYAQIDPSSSISGSSIVLERLRNAVKAMNHKLVENRSKSPNITYDTNNMLRLIQMQNSFIKEELRSIGVDFTRLKAFMNLDAELRKRADAAYLAVKERVDRAKRAAAAKGGVARSTSNSTAGARTADRDVKPSAQAPSPSPNAVSATAVSETSTATMNQGLSAAVSAPAPSASNIQQIRNVSQSPATTTLQVPLAPRQVTPTPVHIAPAPATPIAPKPLAHLVPTPAHTAAAPTVGGGVVAAAPPVANVPTAILPARVTEPPAAAPAHAHASAAVPQSLPAVTSMYSVYTAPAPAPATTVPAPAAVAPAPAAIAPTPYAYAPAPAAITPTSYAYAPAPAAIAPAPTAIAPAPYAYAPASASIAPAPTAIAPAPASIAPAPASIAPAPAAFAFATPAPELETVKREPESVSRVGLLSPEEGRVTSPTDAAGVAGEESKPWYETNVVNHRHAWCCLRDAAERAGMKNVLKGNPWVHSYDASDAGKHPGGCDVLQLMSVGAQFYLKELLEKLTVVAWERKGGLSRELLEGVEARLENPTDSDGEDSPRHELGRGLVPQLPPPGDMPRVLLKEEADRHRQECLEREGRWEAELADKLTAAEELRKRLIRRGQRKLPAGGYKWWDDMEAAVKSGWLSREQLATSLFARRVAIKRGIGVSASNLKKKEVQASREQSSRMGFERINAEVSGDAYLDAFTHIPDVSSSEDLVAAAAATPHSLEERKRCLDPLEEEAPLDTVRNIRRRLALGPAHKDAGVSGVSIVDEEERAETTRKVVISNVDLAEMLRSTKPRGNRRAWARVLYRAQVRPRGANGVRASAFPGSFR